MISRHSPAAVAAAVGSTWNLDAYADAHGWSGVGVGLSQNRDSDPLDQSNFAVMLGRLTGADIAEPGRESCGDADYTDAVSVASFGHWAVGWCETITYDLASVAAVAAVADMAAKLADYPVLDDDDYTDREYAADHSDDGRYCYSADGSACHATDKLGRIINGWRGDAIAALELRYGTIGQSRLLGAAAYHGRLWHALTGRTAAERGQLSLSLTITERTIA